MKLFNSISAATVKAKNTISSKAQESVQKTEIVTKQAKENVQKELTSKLNEAFDEVIQENRSLEEIKSLIALGRESSDKMIDKVANKNALIAGGASLIPGPWGLVAVVPEIYLVTKNQLQLIRDLSIAYGYQEKLNRELLMYLFASSVGAGGIGLGLIHGGKIIVKRSGLRVLQKIVAVLGGKVTQQALKSVTAKWLPIAGAALMAAWAKYSTKKVGEICCELLEKEIVFSSEELTEIESNEGVDQKDDGQIDKLAAIETFKILVNLAKVDGLDKEEIQFLKNRLNELGVDQEKKLTLTSEILSDDLLSVDFDLLSNPLDILFITENMRILSEVDGTVSVEEAAYIDQVKLNLSQLATSN